MKLSGILTTILAMFITCGCASSPPVQTHSSASGRDVEKADSIGVYFLLAGLASLLSDADCEEPEHGELTTLHTTGLPLIADGYMYTLYHEPCAARYWVHESGGIAGVSRLLGPAEADHPVISKLLELLPPREARPSSPARLPHRRGPRRDHATQERGTPAGLGV